MQPHQLQAQCNRIPRTFFGAKMIKFGKNFGKLKLTLRLGNLIGFKQNQNLASQKHSISYDYNYRIPNASRKISV